MNTNRRNFLKIGSLLTSAFIFGFYIPTKAKAISSESGRDVFNPNAFIQIEKDNTITFFIGQVEMGQGAYTGIAMLVADELDAKWDEIIFAPAPVKPEFNRPGTNIMVTGGSRSIRLHQEVYRKVGAALNLMIKQVAAKKWNTDIKNITTNDSTVINKKTKKQLKYGDLVEDLKKIEYPTKVELKESSQFKLIGKPTKRHPIEVEEKLTGKGIFGIDVRLENMKYAAIVHPRVFGARIKSFDDSKAKEMKGVLKIKKLPNEKIAVIATHWYLAKQASESITVVWDNGEFEKISSDYLIKEYKSYLDKEDLPVMKKDGDSDKAFHEAFKVVRAEYSFPFLAHAPMEPLNCTVHHQGSKALITLGGQFQKTYRDKCAEILGLEAENVEYITTYLGGSFGRRGTLHFDFILDAIYAAKEEAWPIQTLWTREDDIKMGCYRPLTISSAKIGLDKEGNITAFECDIINQSLGRGTPIEKGMLVNGIDRTQREGLEDHPYNITNNHIRAFCPESPINVVWLRSVGHTVSAPIMDNIIDQAAIAANIDPLDFRIKNLTKPRFVKLLENVAKQSNWYNREKNSGYGVSVHESFGSIVAYVIKVDVKENDFKIKNVWCSVDCGFAMNPLGIENQIESAVNFVIGYAKYSAITIKDGATEQNNFYDYEVNRITDAPESIKVEIINSGEKIGGIGEVGVPPMFAAIINALYDATGKRYTSFPIKLG